LVGRFDSFAPLTQPLRAFAFGKFLASLPERLKSLGGACA
jgi:hypothetical protein